MSNQAPVATLSVIGSSDEQQCQISHDWFGSWLGILLLTGLVGSYLPQIVRIITHKNSKGLSPWFLLLGATSSASGFFNVLALQWGVVRCCGQLGFGGCLEGLLGVFQVGLQWVLGLVIFGVYLYYYPEEDRYEGTLALSEDEDEEGSDQDEEDDEDDDEIEQEGNSGVASGVEPTPSQSTIARFTDEELRVEEEDVSSSAFARLVPSFWPMWKAPQSHGRVRAGPSPLSQSTTPVTTTQPTGRQAADGTFNAIGASGAPSSSAAGPDGETTSASASDVPAFSAGNGKKVTIAEPPARTAGPGSSIFGLWREEIRKSWRTKSYEWGLATALAWVSMIHLVFVASITLIIVLSLPGNTFDIPHDPSFPAPIPPPVLSATAKVGAKGISPAQLLHGWATFLGITGTVLAAAQYLPQLIYTASHQLVGSLSIPTMMIQTPGTAIFIYSLLLRPGVDWTSILSYCCTGILQGTLLSLCIVWKYRQARLGIDDYGHPLPVAQQEVEGQVAPPVEGTSEEPEHHPTPTSQV